MTNQNSQYFREKARETRQLWSALDFKMVGSYVPETSLPLLRTVSGLEHANGLFAILATRDVERITMLANRKPRVSVTLEDVDILEDRAQNSETVVPEVGALRSLLREARRHRGYGETAIKNGHSMSIALWHFACEYCYVAFIRAVYDLAVLKLSGGSFSVALPEVVAIPPRYPRAHDPVELDVSADNGIFDAVGQ